jgi:hypothetical protein
MDKRLEEVSVLRSDEVGTLRRGYEAQNSSLLDPVREARESNVVCGILHRYEYPLGTSRTEAILTHLSRFLLPYSVKPVPYRK